MSICDDRSWKQLCNLCQDPYFLRNHLGSYECKLCLTLHTNEGLHAIHGFQAASYKSQRFNTWFGWFGFNMTLFLIMWNRVEMCWKHDLHGSLLRRRKLLSAYSGQEASDQSGQTSRTRKAGENDSGDAMDTRENEWKRDQELSIS